MSTFSTTTANYELESTDFDPLPLETVPGVPPGTYVFTIQGGVGDKSQQINFTLVINDPCLTNASLHIDKHLFDQSKSSVDMVLVQSTYILRDPKIDFPWSLTTIASET